MRRLWFAFTIAVVGAVVPSSSANAAPDTWVSGTGVDTGNCPATAPCRSFQYALQQTKDGGTIAVVSSGSFAGVRITKGVTIIAEGVVAILRTPANCGAVVCVDAKQGTVTLRGLIIDPLHSGADGIRVSNVRSLHLKGDIIRQSKIGIFERSPGSAIDGKLDITDSTLTENDQAVRIVGSGETKSAFDRVRIHDNTNGIAFDNTANGGTIVSAISDSVIAGQTGDGIRAVGPAQGTWYEPTVSVTLDRAAVLDNATGIISGGTATRVRLSNSTITGNKVALRSANSGAIPSYGTNKIDGNGASEMPTTTIPSQ